MSRRTATLVVAGLLLVALAIVASTMPVPYAALSPGPTADTLGADHGQPLIRIEQHRTYPTAGSLDLTTVAVSGADFRMDLLHALRGWVDPQVAIVPRETVYPDGTSVEEIKRRNAEEMELSQQQATTAALRSLDIPVTATVIVGAVAKGAPALGVLHAGDRILAVDGDAVSTPQDVRTAVIRHRPGDTVRMGIRQGGRTRTVEIVTGSDAADKAIVGIQASKGYAYPFPVRIRLADVGGPSAGLMFALGVVDKLTPGALTGGRSVAGTGTIDVRGDVGPIGGIQMKIIGAAEAGADVFLTPEGNCSDALAVKPDGLRLVSVRNLGDALHALEALRGSDGRERLRDCEA
ncbi:MAG: YlbL family protein [Carbonactinosporaceae bacterium]